MSERPMPDELDDINEQAVEAFGALRRLFSEWRRLRLENEQLRSAIEKHRDRYSDSLRGPHTTVFDFELWKALEP